MYDYIIVGQGLAGSALALRLIKMQRRILVIDEPARNNSSRIAAGLFNPVTGRRMVKTWMADTLFPCLHEFYTEAESTTGTQFFFPLPIYRPFLSIEEQNEWMARSAEPAYAPFIEKVNTNSRTDSFNDPYGGLMLKQGGYLDTTAFIAAVGMIISSQATLLHQIFDADKLVISDSGIIYDGHAAKKIIFCNGVHNIKWFDWLPVRPLKGETLTINSSFSERLVINRGIYMVPLSRHGSWRVGSTYHFQDKTTEVTSSARDELLSKIHELVHFPVEIVSQEWGMRPTTPDHRPLLGRHPDLHNLFVFNGLGTKGVSLAPYFSQVLIHALENTGPIHKDVDIERYKSLYSGSPS